MSPWTAADLLIGKRGNDKLRRKDGNDELRGGRVKDTLRGGAGAVIQLGADPRKESWPAAADIVAGVVARGDRKTFTLRPGVTLETRTPLRVEEFVLLSGAPVDSPHAVALPVVHWLDIRLARNPGGRLTVPAGEYRDTGGELDSDRNPSTPTPFVAAAAHTNHTRGA